MHPSAGIAGTMITGSQHQLAVIPAWQQNERNLMILRFLAMLVVSLTVGYGPTLTSANGQDTVTGGRFILQNHNGEIVTDQEFAGRFLLVYFGYTYCPAVCPTSLLTMTSAIYQLKDDGDHVQPLFVTVDPERDTVPVLREYVEAFHPNLIGLTGSDAAISSIIGKYRVKAAKVRTKGADDDYYSLDHTASVFLMGPHGRFITRFPYQTTSEQIAAKLREAIKKTMVE